MTLKFSAITVSYNHGEFIRTTIDSVLAQKYPDFEHIVIDGGSTDNTLSILKSYPHLVWVSEKDRGISHALNKGFAKATGDVIAWINSDDWYAPEIFHRVAPLLETHPVVLGNAVQTDRAGTATEVATNLARSYYDLLRYWIPRGWLAQPAVFFRKDALEAVRLPNGDYIDESFGYSMDFDLWLRLAEKFPFTTHVDTTFAYFRVYGENKTGRVFATPQRELGRAFRASISRRRESERKVTYVVPVLELTEPIKATIQSLVSQKLSDVEVLFVDCLEEPAQSKNFREVIQAIEEHTTLTTVRVVKTPGTEFEHTVEWGMRDARSPIVCVLRVGDVASPHLTENLLNYFAHDPHGGMFLGGPDRPQMKTLGDPENRIVVPNTLLSLEHRFHPFAVRKIVFEELNNFLFSSIPLISQRLFLLRMLNRGWLIVDPETELLQTESSCLQDETELSRLLQPYTKAKLLIEGYRDTKNDIFHGTRSLSPYAPTYPKEMVEVAERALTFAPENLGADLLSLTREDANALANRFSSFAPLWWRIKQLSMAANDFEMLSYAKEQLERLR